MVNDKIANDIAGLQASRLNNVIDPNPQYTDTTFSKEVTELFDPSCLAYLDSEGRLCVDSVTVSSEIIFNYPFSELMEKGVEEIRIQFTVEGEGNPVFAGFGLGSSTVKDFKSYEIVINDTVNVDETISTLSFSKEDVAYYMKTGLFRLYLVFLQGNSVCNVKLSNVIVTFTYTNNIINEVKVIENRLKALGITGEGSDVDFDSLVNRLKNWFYDETEVNALLNEKQDTLVSGSNIKTINNQSLLGSGNISLQGGGSDVVDLIYPVGSIYMSVNSVNPATLFGGEWEQIKDKFLLSAGDTYSNATEGGSADAVVVKHNHTQNAHYHNANSDGTRSFMTAPTGSTWNEIAGSNISGSGYHYVVTQDKSNYNVWVNQSANATATNKESGVDGTGKNMPPYLTVNVWKRTA